MRAHESALCSGADPGVAAPQAHCRIRTGIRRVACTRAALSATIQSGDVETLIIALSIITAAAAAVIVVVVLTRVVRPSRGALSALRPWTTAGFRWFMLGIAGTAVFALLDLSVAFPLLVMLAGLAATGVGVYRQWKNRD